MTQRPLSPQQQAKLSLLKAAAGTSSGGTLSEALAVAKLAEEKASQMSDLATAIANKYQQRLYESHKQQQPPLSKASRNLQKCWRDALRNVPRAIAPHLSNA